MTQRINPPGPISLLDGSVDAADLPSGIAATKIADGSVSNTEFQRLDTLTVLLNKCCLIPAIVLGRQSVIGTTDGTSGDKTLYTVPANKAAMMVGSAVYNPTGSSHNISAKAVLSGNTVQVLATTAVNANSAGTTNLFNNFFHGALMLAGDTFILTLGSALAMNYSLGILEVDYSNLVQVSAVLGSGDTTIYTVPTGKKAIIASITGGQSAPQPAIRISNRSGGSLNYYLKYKPSGASAIQFGVATALADQASPTNSAFIGFGYMAEGDSIIVNSSGAGSNQIAFSTILEL